MRQEKRKSVVNENGKLYSSLVDKDSARFWRLWKSISQSKETLPPQIDGYANNHDISNRFRDVFSEVYRSNDVISPDHLKSEFDSIFPDYFVSHIMDDISQYYFSWQDMVDMVL